jgi:hypothetical protein
MPKPPDGTELPLWEPYVAHSRKKKHREYFRDVEREIITVIDDYGVTRLPLSEMPAAVLNTSCSTA